MLRYLFPLRLRQWLGPLLVAGVAGVLLAILIVATGWVDLSARKPHPDGWARFLHYTFRRSTAFHAGPRPPADLDSPVRIAAGAAYYGQVCAHCHGGPGLGQNPVVLAMHPRPQFLATDLIQPGANYAPRELFRIVHAGVKYSAMPSWPASGRDDEVWQLVAFLRALPKLTPEQFRALVIAAPRPAAADAARRAFGPTAIERPYAMINDREPPLSSYSYRWPVYAFGSDTALSGDPVATCARCHGADGAGRGAFPNLTLQDPSYLRRTLAAFASGRRQSGFMRVVASGLSPHQIAALAEHYAVLPRKATDPGSAADPLGQLLALVGDAAHGLGPCAGCHGVSTAAAKAYPVLDGQSAWYIAQPDARLPRGRPWRYRGPEPDAGDRGQAGRPSDRGAGALLRLAGRRAPRQSFAAVATR